MPGGRPSKPIELVKGHRTKAEIETRKKAEKEMMTGSVLKEGPGVKANRIAHKEFSRLRRLLKEINYNDDLWGTMINTLAKLKGEEAELEELKSKFLKSLEKAEQIELSADNMDTYLRSISEISKSIKSLDTQIMAKRKMALDISKENIMTIQGALRTIPKKPSEKKEESAMASFLNKRKQGGINA